MVTIQNPAHIWGGDSIRATLRIIKTATYMQA